METTFRAGGQFAVSWLRACGLGLVCEVWGLGLGKVFEGFGFGAFATPSAHHPKP